MHGCLRERVLVGPIHSRQNGLYSPGLKKWDFTGGTGCSTYLDFHLLELDTEGIKNKEMCTI